MPTSPVKTRIPLTSFGHLISEVKRQLFGIEAPATVDLTGWRRHFNTYTLQGRRNFVLVTYAALALGAAAYAVNRRDKQTQEVAESITSSQA
ncbi:ATP synthase membrane subunit K, mitochondrial-like [Alosa sapidissima]|nr:ATP synthase membrane subunit K, mitochondrial-like [Alosa sapidissima]